MPKIIWDPAYSVGVKEFDAQHQHLVDFMNEIYDKLDRNSMSAEEMKDFFRRIAEHAREHFVAEEKDFELFNYPDAGEHIAQHRMIETRIAELQQEFQTNQSPRVIYDTLQLVGHWLFVHIKEHDQKYTRCFNEHGLF